MGVDGQALVGGHLAELGQMFAGMRLTGEVTPRLHARAMAMGELMATTLGAAWLRGRGPVWAEALAETRAVRVAVDQVSGDADTAVRDGAEVAYFPPVTGG